MPVRINKEDVRGASQPRYQTELIGIRIKELRLGRQLTISRLADISGVPGSTISKIENGQLRPSFVHAMNLASACNRNSGFLVRDFVTHHALFALSAPRNAIPFTIRISV